MIYGVFQRWIYPRNIKNNEGSAGRLYARLPPDIGSFGSRQYMAVLELAGWKAPSNNSKEKGEDLRRTFKS
jgi:hypothetical protein